MEIKILYFGAIADITGKENDNFNNFSNLEDLINHLESKYSDLNDSEYQISVNQEIVKSPLKLSKDDEIALLPPFSGG